MGTRAACSVVLVWMLFSTASGFCICCYLPNPIQRCFTGNGTGAACNCIQGVGYPTNLTVQLDAGPNQVPIRGSGKCVIPNANDFITYTECNGTFGSVTLNSTEFGILTMVQSGRTSPQSMREKWLRE